MNPPGSSLDRVVELKLVVEDYTVGVLFALLLGRRAASPPYQGTADVPRPNAVHATMRR